MRSKFRFLEQMFNGATWRHLERNYSATEIGFRHPDGPVGAMARDQGVLDLYSGESRLLLTLAGTVATMGERTVLATKQTTILPSHISEFRLIDRILDEEIYRGKEVATMKRSLDGVEFVTADTTTTSGDRLLNTVPVNEYLEPSAVFRPDEPTVSREVRIYRVVGSFL